MWAKNKYKIVSSIIVTIIAILYFLPNIQQSKSNFLTDKTVNLGLDLKGGSHLLLHTDFNSYLADQMQIATNSIRKALRDNKVKYKGLKTINNEISLEILNSEQVSIAKKTIRKIDNYFDIETAENKFLVKFNDLKLESLKNKLIEQSIEIIRMRVDETGTKEPIIQRQGEDNILLQVPGLDDPATLKNLLGKTAKLTFHIVDETATANLSNRLVAPIGSMIVKELNSQGQEQFYVVKKRVILSGDMLDDAQAAFNQHGQPIVDFAFNNLGAKLFGEATKRNSGKRLAIILDGKIVSAPVINEPILGGRGNIHGNFTVQSANELALLLRAGALPAPLKVIEERTIGPNLGADSIESGKKAGLIGFVAVVIFMLWTYGVVGVFAVIALCLCMVYIIAMLSAVQATLTLPGIAGIILTIGMAVDANVLIFERIREEIKNGLSNQYAIAKGFESAFATITDSNVTTLIAALLLYSFGVGAIKGFAVTLTIGIIASMFTALVITKVFIDLWVDYYKPRSLGI